MTELIKALRLLGLQSEVSFSGRWAKVEGAHCAFFVAEATNGGYYCWCDDPSARTVQFHQHPVEAIHAGMERAAKTVNSERTNESHGAEFA